MGGAESHFPSLMLYNIAGPGVIQGKNYLYSTKKYSLIEMFVHPIHGLALSSGLNYIKESYKHYHLQTTLSSPFREANIVDLSKWTYLKDKENTTLLQIIRLE